MVDCGGKVRDETSGSLELFSRLEERKYINIEAITGSCAKQGVSSCSGVVCSLIDWCCVGKVWIRVELIGTGSSHFKYQTT